MINRERVERSDRTRPLLDLLDHRAKRRQSIVYNGKAGKLILPWRPREMQCA